MITALRKKLNFKYAPPARESRIENILNVLSRDVARRPQISPQSPEYMTNYNLTNFSHLLPSYKLHAF
jgi:hypothetical protein